MPDSDIKGYKPNADGDVGGHERTTHGDANGKKQMANSDTIGDVAGKADDLGLMCARDAESVARIRCRRVQPDVDGVGGHDLTAHGDVASKKADVKWR